LKRRRDTMPKSIASRLDALERRCSGNDELSGRITEWVEKLENWPDEWIRPEDGDGPVPAERVADVKAACRDLAAKLRDDMLQDGSTNDEAMFHLMLERLPDEALCGLYEWGSKEWPRTITGETE